MKCYCLTVSQTPWRNEAVQKRFQDAGLEVEMFYGIHGSTVGIAPTMTVWDAARDNPYRINPGKLSITISKLLLWQKILDSGIDECIIFENDVTFCPDFLHEFRKSYQALPPDWEAAHIGHCCTEGKPSEILNDRISRIKYPLCCHAMLWKRSGLQKAYSVMSNASWGTTSDVILERAVYPFINHYCFTPKLAFQDETPSEAGKTENWTDIHGWFDYQRVYDEQLDSFGYNPATIVEVGSWLGRSTAYMAEEIKRRLKPVRFYAVDTWQGSANEPLQQPTIAEHQGDLYPQFLRNMARCGVLDYVTPIRKPSVEAAKDFPDGSLDFVFIDADHSFNAVVADIRAWRPKVHYHRCMAGHDINREEVRRAVEQEFPGQWRTWELCWIVDHVV